MTEYFTIVNKIEQGYTRQPNAALKDPDLTDAAVRVLFFLLSITNGFHPTTKKIANTLHMSEKKVQRSLTILKNTGYISITRVKNGSLYGGMLWQISNYRGYFTNDTEQKHQDKNDHIYQDKNDRVENDHIYPVKNDQICTDKNDVVENVPAYMDKINGVENDHISELPIGQIPIDVNNQGELPYCEQPLYCEQPPLSLEDNEVVTQFKGGDSISSFQGKKPVQGEKVISQTEYLYQQLRTKYPPHRLGDYAGGLKAFQSIPDIFNVYQEIVQGLESWKQSESWNQENGKYVPGLVKFLNERKWKTPPTWTNSTNGLNDYGNSDAYKAGLEKWRQIEMQN